MLKRFLLLGCLLAVQLFSNENTLAGRDLLSMRDLSKEEIEHILTTAKNLEITPQKDLMKGLVLASCFFEPSTRTRLSFETAMLQLGGSVIGFSESSTTSVKKGETLFDTMKAVDNFADIIVIRHPEAGSAHIAAEAAAQSVINAGDGASEHPTQTLLDLYTMQKTQGKIEGLHIALVGDLKHARTIHSLVLALSHYPVHLYFVAPKGLELPESIAGELLEQGVDFSCYDSLEEVVPLVDILYMTRIQKERFVMSEGFVNPCILKRKHLDLAKPNLKILHPLPRIDEIEKSIDETPYAAYFEQMSNGVYVRMALLSLLLGRL